MRGWPGWFPHKLSDQGTSRPSKGFFWSSLQQEAFDLNNPSHLKLQSAFPCLGVSFPQTELRGQAVGSSSCISSGVTSDVYLLCWQINETHKNSFPGLKKQQGWPGRSGGNGGFCEAAEPARGEGAMLPKSPPPGWVSSRPPWGHLLTPASKVSRQASPGAPAVGPALRRPVVSYMAVW